MSKEALLAVRKRAIEDPNFYTHWAQGYPTVLVEYTLTLQGTIAEATRDVCCIESYTGIEVAQRLIEDAIVPLLSQERWYFIFN